jgi:hypothetical protein
MGISNYIKIFYVWLPKLHLVYIAELSKVSMPFCAHETWRLRDIKSSIFPQIGCLILVSWARYVGDGLFGNEDNSLN